MEAAEYKAMDRGEAAMWWYRALHRNLLLMVRRHSQQSAPLVLDAGCGTGRFMALLGDALPDATIVGFDRSSMAYRRAREKTAGALLCADVNALPFADSRFDVIISADVLYHDGVDEASALKDLARCLKRDGAVLLNLPAYDWLRSEHDRRVHTARRYTIGRVSRALEQAGLTVIAASYWNSVLFPLMVIRRKLLPPSPNESEVDGFSAPVNALFDLVCRGEHLLMRMWMRLPFGGSVLVLAAKK